MSDNQLYKNISVRSEKADEKPRPKQYRGISTINENTKSYNLYDLELIKQDIINHFHIRQGEKLSDPEFGTIIWDVLYDPLTDSLKEAIIENVTEIINYDPRVSVNSILIDTYESGIRIEAEIVYLPYNISETMRLRFDQSAGLN